MGQLVRWSWGYNVLLAPLDDSEGTHENVVSRLESGEAGPGETEPLMGGVSSESERDEQNASGSDDTRVNSNSGGKTSADGSQYFADSRSGQQTPVTHLQRTSSFSSKSSDDTRLRARQASVPLTTPANGNVKPLVGDERVSFSPSMFLSTASKDDESRKGLKGVPDRCWIVIRKALYSIYEALLGFSKWLFTKPPDSVQKGLAKTYSVIKRFCLGVWSFMNPPLWAMLAAIVVASIPDLQHFFFSDGSFVKNSVTSAIRQSGGVAVPLILVVLGANLARNTLPADSSHTEEDEKEETKLLIAALISRMLLPLIVVAPLLALTAKFIPVSILDDPIFVIVCFLITGAPSALQLAQICQINNVYMGAMSRLLFQSYVVWILPSTLVLVMSALEVVEWAQR